MTSEKIIENDWSAEEKRAYKRQSIEFYWRIFDMETGALAGDVVDISLEGFRLLTDTPITIDKPFQFRMDISLENGRKAQTTIEAVGVWQTDNINPRAITADYTLMTLPPDTAELIESIIEEVISSI